ncbi:MAG TPA: gliding motility protein GldN [Bacteroidia bacterium]|nr:gliding motility protein GldN [Bacteroidia bacterium]
MRKLFLLAVAVTMSSLSSFAQQSGVLDGIYPPENTATRIYLEYPYVREADALWRKRIWRIIDLREKINLPLGYPKTETTNRKSLMDIIWNAVKEGTLTAWSEDEFISPKTVAEIEKSGGAGIDSTTYTEADPPYNVRDTVYKREFSPEKVIQYRIKEDWFFDKQRSVIEARIIGIAPVVYATDERGNVREGGETKALFWVYFPEARRLLSQAEVFNRENDSERRTFDDVFHKRLFNSYIMKESNVYDRYIASYAQGMKALQESDRIKDEITNFEHDMWEY